MVKLNKISRNLTFVFAVSFFAHMYFDAPSIRIWAMFLAVAFCTIWLLASYAVRNP